MDSLNKFFLIAAGLIVTAGLIFVGFRMADIGTETANQVIDGFNGFRQELEESKIMQYDGITVTGSDVVNFMRKHLSPTAGEQEVWMKITVVKGEKSVSYQKYEEIKEIYNFSHTSYVNPTALFQGSVIKNENGVISEVRFEQKLGNEEK